MENLHNNKDESKTSWDNSLVKKFSSSNHFKMLNQLRNEVIKYPLNKKKNLSSNIPIENKNKNHENQVNSTDLKFIKNSNINNDIDNNKSTVSFNNSKDFSIYNNATNITNKDPQENYSLDFTKSNVEISSSTFKDRLNQIDLK